VRDHGFTVLAGARNPGEVVADENLVPLRLDVRDPDSVGAAIAGIEANPGSLDVLVNNAGIYGDATGAADYDLDEAHEVLETNIFGPWRLIQASLPLLRSSASPRIVNVSSGAGQLAEMDGGHTAYRLSKSALNALTRTLAVDEPEISVNSICPGWVRPDMGGSRAPRSVEEGADTAVWLATMADDVPSGGFFRNREPIPW
jgi:NAD(P)-dependent dehydrogenase (short-subunit alcohol dehydrogenase family)